MNKRILYLIQQAGMLIEMPRTHIRNLGNNAPDTIASHSYHVSIIAYCIARMEGLDHQSGLKALAMGTFHDLAEARTGDVDFVGKHYTTVDENKAVRDQFADIAFGNDLLALVDEYEERESLEAKCAKDADALAQMYIEWILAWHGNKLAQKWFDGDYTNRVPYLRTESARILALQMRDSDPHQWWLSEFAVKGVNSTHLNGKK
jgi:putative hydrolase of HD superfamily